MAIDTAMYSPKQFMLSILPETTLGTKNVTSMHLINLEGYPSITRGVTRVLDVRHGVGQTAKKADAFVDEYGAIKEISFTALYDQTTAPIFISNCMGVAVSTSPASYDIAYNFTTVECKIGDEDTNSTGALTVAIVSPEEGYSEVYPGCFVDTLKMSADAGSDGGRFKMEVTLKTRSNADHSVPVTDPTFANSDVPYVTYRTLWDLATKCSVGGADVVMNKFEISLNSQVKFYGCGTNGAPQTIGRGFPEFICSGLFGIKYDVNSAGLVQSQYAEADVAVEISNHATWASATFGVKGSYGQISDNFDVGEVEAGAFIDVPLKFLASTSGDVLQVCP